jgi:hypothetical protein
MARRSPAAGSAPPLAGPRRDAPRSVWIALTVLALLAPTAARSPQTGDGAEIVAIALQGGVLHPPGFPLQAWIDRILVRIPGIEPAHLLSLLGLASHAAASGLVAETLRWLGVGGIGRVLGAGAFALYPPIWALAGQPEVFALAHLLVAATILLSVRISREPSKPASTRSLALLGLLGSLGAAQHPVALVALPALAVGGARGLRQRSGGARRWFLGAALLLLPAAALYLSLPLLRSDSPWPDWGALRTPGDVLQHALRRDYGTFSLAATTGSPAVLGIGVWLEDVLRDWNVALPIAVLGLVEIARRRDLRSAAASILGTAALGLLLLDRARLPQQTYSAAVLEHLQGPMAIAGSLLIGLGTEALGRRASPAARRFLLVAAVAVVGAWLSLGWPVADLSRDRTLTLYARGVALELRDEHVYVTEGDVEAFLGVPTAHGPRYPVSQPLASLPWYVQGTWPRLEPRVLGGRPVETWDGFLRACFAQRRSVVSSSPSLIATPDAVPELRGLVFVADSGATEELTAETVAGAIRLATLAKELPVLPARGHAFSRFYVRRFARAYAGAAEALRRRGAMQAAVQADSVADALNQAAPSDRRARLLDSFVASCRDLGS